MRDLVTRDVVQVRVLLDTGGVEPLVLALESAPDEKALLQVAEYALGLLPHSRIFLFAPLAEPVALRRAFLQSLVGLLAAPCVHTTVAVVAEDYVA